MVMNFLWSIKDEEFWMDCMTKEDVCSIELLELFQIFDQQSVSKYVCVCACVHFKQGGERKTGLPSCRPTWV